MKQLLTAVALAALTLAGCASEAPAPSPAPATTFGAAGAEKAAREPLAGTSSSSGTLSSDAGSSANGRSSSNGYSSSGGSSDLDRMVEAYQDGGVSFPRSHAAGYADITCEAIQDGLMPTRVADMWSQEISDYSVSDHYILTGAAIGAYCPEYLSLIG